MTSPRFTLHLITLLSLLIALAGGALRVTPARAAALVVTKTADTADGVCDADCSLREAIIAANAAAGDDTITLPAGTYTLTIAGAGENAAATGDLDINSNITLNGAGAGSTIIQAGTLGVGGPPNGIDRVFHITAADTLNLSGVTIRHGNLPGGLGGAIYNNAGTLVLTNSAISGSSADTGGGIFNNAGTLALANSAISGNSADSSGGGLDNEGGTVSITNSTFSGNSVNSQGGGIFTYFGTLAVANSTFSLNTSMDGGGIFNFGGTASISNSTFSGNSANDGLGGGNGGGLLVFRDESIVTITNSTFSGNSAGGYGGGLRISASTATLRNTIVANSPSGGNCSGLPVTNGGSNIDSGQTCGWGAANGSASGADPMLGALTGSPAYYPLNNGSPAVDAGSDAVCAAAPVSNASQNGLTRPQGPHCDIGSYEAADTTAPTVVSVTRAGANPTRAASVGFSVTFSEAVTGVDPADFGLTLTGSISSAAVMGVTGGPSAYTVAVSTGAGSGTLGLIVPLGASIADLAGNPLTGLPYPSAEAYAVRFYPSYLPRLLK